MKTYKLAQFDGKHCIAGGLAKLGLNRKGLMGLRKQLWRVKNPFSCVEWGVYGACPVS